MAVSAGNQERTPRLYVGKLGSGDTLMAFATGPVQYLNRQSMEIIFPVPVGTQADTMLPVQLQFDVKDLYRARLLHFKYGGRRGNPAYFTTGFRMSADPAADLAPEMVVEVRQFVLPVPIVDLVRSYSAEYGLEKMEADAVFMDAVATGSHNRPPASALFDASGSSDVDHVVAAASGHDDNTIGSSSGKGASLVAKKKRHWHRRR
jgi:hypothetical protein